MISSKTYVMLLNLVLLVILASSTSVGAQTAVTIVVKGSSVSISPAQLYSVTEYAIYVKVLDANDNPVANTEVSMVRAGGTLTIEGNARGTTGADGTSELRIIFSTPGVAKLLVGGKALATVSVFTSGPLLTTSGFLAIILVLYIALLSYALVAGPVKWLQASPTT